MEDVGAVHVDPSNAEALRAWNAADGDYWSEHADRFDASMAPHHRRLLESASIRPREQVLDIGCGNGQTTRDAAKLAAPGFVLGVDLSRPMIERARQRAVAEALDNVRFEQGDAQVYDFERGTFDVVISRAGVMFFGDPVAAFANIARALRRGGRMAALVWQGLDRNEWIGALRSSLAAGRSLPVPPPDAPGPFALADPARVEAILTHAGFDEIAFENVEEPMRIGDDADDAYRFVRGMGFTSFLLEGLDERQRDRALEVLRADIDAHATSDGVRYRSGAWIVTAHA
jgi:SAM-dependent methyltransferase